ncbi:MAG: ABC transporter ATP-binding protein/permease, partial [Clostridia bacterium]|nr:ABC transporter ATP-binding protein/permease [Clostridia bacterium]
RYSDGFRGRQEVFRKASLDYSVFSIRARAFLSILGSAVQMAAFCYCLYLLWTGRIVYGTMTLFLSQGTKLSATFQKLVSTVPAFLTGSVSAHRIRELEELEKEPHLGGCELSEEEQKQGLRIFAEDLQFSYAEHPVFSGVRFEAAPGEIVALVGPSGEGKTTMLRLLLGLITPDRGRVYLQSEAGRTYPANADLRSCFSYVPQGNTVLSGTIAENLRMGKADASDEELEHALRLACAWDFVSRLPDGINSTMGERGRGFSEGQAQRIAIARAILRGAPILLLDEATSALDAETEKQVLQNIMRRSTAQTCIVTTHRPSVLQLCSRAYLIRDNTLQALSADEAARAAENAAGC